MIANAASCLTLQMILGKEWAQTKAQLKAPDQAKRNIMSRILEQNWQHQVDIREFPILKDSPKDIVQYPHCMYCPISSHDP